MAARANLENLNHPSRWVTTAALESAWVVKERGEDQKQGHVNTKPIERE